MSLWMHLIPGYTVTKALTATVGLLSDSSSKPLSELEEIGRRVEIESAALLSQAKVEQEVSIARRILCAQEVEIEEFYDQRSEIDNVINSVIGNQQLAIIAERRSDDRTVFPAFLPLLGK